MRAQVLHEFGDADEFTLEDVPTPDPEAGQVRVRVYAIGLNPMDVKIRNGWLREEIPTPLPAILGTDLAGVVDGVGAGATGLAVGDHVVGLADSGAYAEYALVRADKLAPIPAPLDYAHAATVPTAAETSRRVIALLASGAGETVVVNGAAGSVGSIAVQLLVRAGATVIGTAGADNQDYVRRLGAVPTTYGDGVVDRIRALAPDGVDAVFDVTGHGFADAAIALRGGTDRIVTIADFDAAKQGITVSASDASSITAADFAPVLAFAAAGDLVTEIAQTFPFAEVPAAHRMSEGGHLRGKIVITGPEPD